MLVVQSNGDIEGLEPTFLMQEDSNLLSLPLLSLGFPKPLEDTFVLAILDDISPLWTTDNIIEGKSGFEPEKTHLSGVRTP